MADSRQNVGQGAEVIKALRELGTWSPQPGARPVNRDAEFEEWASAKRARLDEPDASRKEQRRRRDQAGAARTFCHVMGHVDHVNALLDPYAHQCREREAGGITQHIAPTT